MTEFLTLKEILILHESQLDAHGGQAGIRDQGALESAVATPMQTYGGELLHETIFEQAAAYAFHIAESQAFVDGNKRTALSAAIVFLEVNGWDVSQGKYPTRLSNALIAIAEHELDKAGLALLLESVSRPARGNGPST